MNCRPLSWRNGIAVSTIGGWVLTVDGTPQSHVDLSHPEELHFEYIARMGHIIDEAFVRVHINLLAVKGTKLDQVKQVRCMSILLGQCGTFLKDHNLATLNWTDNAAAARDVAALGDPAEAALASELAGEIYGLDVLATEKI